MLMKGGKQDLCRPGSHIDSWLGSAVACVAMKHLAKVEISLLVLLVFGFVSVSDSCGCQYSQQKMCPMQHIAFCLSSRQQSHGL